MQDSVRVQKKKVILFLLLLLFTHLLAHSFIFRYIPKQCVEELCWKYPELKAALYDVAAKRIRKLESLKNNKNEIHEETESPEVTYRKRADTESVRSYKLLTDFYLIHPDSYLKFTWDFIVAVWVLYFVLFVPYRLSFNVEGFFIMDTIGDIVFCMDILVLFRTSYYDKETRDVVTDWKRISKEYLKSWFIVDLISALPFDHIIASSSDSHRKDSIRSLKLLRVLRLFRWLRLLRVFKLRTLIGEVLGGVYISPAVSEFFQTLSILVFFTHFYACAWFYSADVNQFDCSEKTPERCPQLYETCCNTTRYDTCSSGNGDIPPLNCSVYRPELHYSDNWISNYGNKIWPEAFVPDTDMELSKYILSLYWTYMTFLSVGYGDVTAMLNPLKSFEVVTSILGMAIGSLGILSQFLSLPKVSHTFTLFHFDTQFNRYDVFRTIFELRL